ncbi:unnamed protein product [Diamesa tonsa]
MESVEMKDAESVNIDEKVIVEGSATIYEEGQVFYNPVQEFNRDISICVLNTFSKIYQEEIEIKKTKKRQKHNGIDPDSTVEQTGKLKILEALSATGLRSIRYAKEVDNVEQIIANDLSKEAVEMIRRNVKNNNVEDIVIPNFADAMTLMYTSTKPDKRFTAIDLDPYGCPNRFLDGALQSVQDGGLLLITATDMAVLAGNTPEACYIKYGSIPLKSKACHEIALRILLKCIEGHANRYGRYIKPLMSLSIDFYVRVFVRVYTGQLQCKESSTKQSMVFQCTGCEALTFQPLAMKKPTANPNSNKYGLPTGPFVGPNCEHCSHRHHMGGPIWSDPIHDPEFLEQLMKTVLTDRGSRLGTYRRIVGILAVVQEELHDIPLYYTIEKLSCVLKLEMMPMLKLRSALLFEGFRVSYSHASKTSIKTDAPIAVIWDILRCWAKVKPVKPERYLEGSALKAILSVEPLKEYRIHDIHPLANPNSRKESLSRFPENPAMHWGPGTRATLMVGKDKMSKSVRNQNKYKDKREKKHIKLPPGTIEDPEVTSPVSKQIKLDDNLVN